MKLGVTGVGYLGEHHTRILTSLPGVEVVGVCDVDSGRGKRIAERYGTSYFEDFEDLLGKVDGMVVAVPTELHYEVGKRVLEAGVNLLLEKPIAASVKDAYELVELAEQKELVFLVGHIERFNPAVLALEGKVLSPVFIEAKRTSLRTGEDPQSLIIDLMIHDIDLALYFSGKRPEKVRGRIVSCPDGPAFAVAELDFGSSFAVLTASRSFCWKERKMRIAEQDRVFSIDFVERKSEVVERNGIPFRLPVRDEEPLRLELVSFIDAIRGKPLPFSPSDAVLALEVGMEVVRSCGI
ncbi:gfo/Idh/MocA family oxidoreductase [bacterium]|nr:MAG: gfo/Idh/MocA family oxidoreductase [bacterium]